MNDNDRERERAELINERRNLLEKIARIDRRLVQLESTHDEPRSIRGG